MCSHREEMVSLFGKIVRLATNVVVLPVEVVKDVYTLGGVATDQSKSYTRQQLEKIADEADD